MSKIDRNLTLHYTEHENLENEISEDASPVMKGDTYMGRQKVQITLPSGESTWITGSTLNDLVQNALSKISYSGNGMFRGSTETFRQYTDHIFDIFLKPRWKDSTAETNRFLLNKHIRPYFDNLMLGEIDVATIQQFFQTKQHLSKSYTKQMLIMLHEIFENAVEDKKMPEDPTLSKRITLPKKVTKRNSLEDKQYKDILSHLKDLDDEDALLMALLCYTGMRRGEILGLKWDCVLDDRIIIQSEVVFKGNCPVFCEYTKSASGIREIPIPKELKPYLRKRGTGFVVGGSSPYSQCKFTRAWQRINKQINLYGATPHVFRHTYLTMLAASGVDPKTIQVIAGHSDFSFTFNKYIDKNGQNVKDASTYLSKHIRKISTNGTKNGTSRKTR